MSRVRLLTAALVAGLLLSAGGTRGDDKKVGVIHRINPPDVLFIQTTKGPVPQAIEGKYLVRPDGTISLAGYTPVRVAGLTVDEARKAVAEAIRARLAVKPEAVPLAQLVEGVHIEVATYASNVYYVIVQNDKKKDRVASFPATGKDTVLDALARVGKVERLGQRKLYIVRPSNDGSQRAKTLLIEWQTILQGTSLRTNHQLLPGDILMVIFEPAEQR